MSRGEDRHLQLAFKTGYRRIKVTQLGSAPQRFIRCLNRYGARETFELLPRRLLV